MDRPLGGLEPVQSATPDIQNICDEVKPLVEQKTGRDFGVFVAKSFTSQLVAGTNYFIKVHVGGEEFVHLRVFQSLPHDGEYLQLHNIQTGKSQHDELSYF